MCYASPAPRCSHHAKLILERCESNYTQAMNSQNLEKIEAATEALLDAKRNYFMTPDGQKSLREKIEANGDEDGSLGYSLEYGIECRKVALLQAKSADRGDVLDESDGLGTRLPSSSHMKMTPEHEALHNQLIERTSSAEFIGMLERRDTAVEAWKEARNKQKENEDKLANLQEIASNPNCLREGKRVPKYTEEEVFDAQESIDDTHEHGRTLVNLSRAAHYEKMIARKEVEDFKDETAMLVNDINIVAGDPGKPYEGETLGDCVKVATYDSGTKEWLETRQGGLGGSEIGNALKIDPQYSYSNFTSFIESKTREYTPEEIEAQALNNSEFKGALGRGNAWESQIVREFEAENPDMTVFFTKSSWSNKDNETYKANVDGLLASDGVNVDGILEIKTSSHLEQWYTTNPETGEQECAIPIGYRAQVLWYMRQTGFKYAYVAAKIDDGTYIQRRIEWNEAIDPTPVVGKDGVTRPRVGTLEENMPELDRVWKEEVVARNEGSYPASSGRKMKDTFDDTIDASKVHTLAHHLTAWNDKDYASNVERIKGYTAYKRQNEKAGTPYLSKDAYIVQAFKEGGMKTWTKDRVSVDIETTASTPASGEIIEIGVTRVNPKGEVVYSYHERYGLENETMLDVNGTGFQEVHKIAPDDIRGKRTFGHPEVQAIMQKHLNDPDAVMIAHNEIYEKRWFNHTVDNFHKNHAYGTTQRYRNIREGKPSDPYASQDTMLTSKFFVHHTKNNKLETFSEGHGIPYQNAHSADADALMTFEADKVFDENLQSAPVGMRYQPDGDYDEKSVWITPVPKEAKTVKTSKAK